MTPSYALGLFFIACVTIIWSLASIVIQFLYTVKDFNSPFLLTYIGTTLFTLFLPTRLLWERAPCCRAANGHVVVPWRTDNVYHNIPSTVPNAIADSDHTTTTTTSCCTTTTGTSQPTQRLQHDVPQNEPPRILSHQQHCIIALKIAPAWFIGNWAYNSSLATTSITSSTVLASTGSLFTFLFAVSCGDEKFTMLKLVGVLLGVGGSIITGWKDTESSTGQDAVWGDALGLASAVGYGTYTVMIRVLCPKDERAMSMQLLLGYIGLWNAVILSPIAAYIVLQQRSAATSLTLVVLGYLVAQGLLDNVLSDYLWARAVILTSATVATVGLGLTIPLAFVSDWMLGHGDVYSAASIVGALAVLAGFVVVNLEGVQQDNHLQDESDEELEEIPVDNYGLE